jgi:hypothetical protein
MDIIGKRVRVQIGGEPPKPDHNVIIGDDTLVHVPESDAGKYSNIIGEKVEVSIGSPDSIVQQIHDIIQNDSHPLKEQVLANCQSILKERDIAKKRNLIQTLINNAGNVASIAGLIAQLAQLHF